MSSAKRPYNETISSNPINDNDDNNDYIVNVVEEQHEVEEDMEIEHYPKVEQMSKQSDSFKNQQEAEEESFISSRRKRLNTDKDTFISNPFPSTLNNHSFKSLSSTSSTRNTLNYSSLRNTISSTPYPPSGNTSFYKVPTTTNVTHHPLSESNYISPRDSFNPSNSTLKVSEIEQDTKALSPIDLLMSSPPISTSTQKTNRTRNTSNSSLTLTTNNLDTWNNIEDFNYAYSSPRNSASKLRARTNANTITTNDSSAEALNSTITSYFNVANPYSSLNSNNDNPENIINNDSSSNENYSNNDNINNVSSINGNNDNPSSNNDNINNSSSNNDPTSNNDYFSSIYATAPNNQLIRTQLTKNGSKGPFKPIYSQLYDNKRMVVDTESFNYLIQLYEFCDNSSTKLQSNVTSILRDLVLLLNNQIDGFDIPFIEHHKWNGSSFYGPIDVITLLDQLDDGLGLSLAEFVYYDHNYKYDDYMRASGFVLQCGCRKTFRKNNYQGSSFTSTSNDANDLQNNELRHAVLDKDAEREAQLFLELLAQEEDDGVEDNGTEQGENSTEQDSSSEQDESDSFTEISKESEEDDEDYSLNEDFASASIQQPTDTFGNPINSIRTTSIVARHISRPSGNDDGNETDDDSGNLSESTFEEVDFSDIESIATDSTIEDGWHSVSRDNN